MAISGDIRVSAALGSSPTNLLRTNSPPQFKVGFGNFVSGGSSVLETTSKRPSPTAHIRTTRRLGVGGTHHDPSPSTTGPGPDTFLFNAVNMSFLERLALAWKIVFPSAATIRYSNANLAKQRLKMILFSDRCAVSEAAKQKIVSNVVSALSDFVVIESEDHVQLSVSTDPALGTIYSVTVPVRRVRAEYQEASGGGGTIVNVEYKDTGATSGSVDVKFDFYVPSE